MAGVGMLDDDNNMSAFCCKCFVGFDTANKVAVNFWITLFGRHCISTTGSYLAGIVLSSLWFNFWLFLYLLFRNV
jgi:hypothetical protein